MALFYIFVITLMVGSTAAAATATATAAATAQQPLQSEDWQPVTTLHQAAASPGMSLSIVGPPQQPWARGTPHTLDGSLLDDFLSEFNMLQRISSTGDNMFTDTSEQVRARTVGGLVWRGVGGGGWGGGGGWLDAVPR